MKASALSLAAGALSMLASTIAAQASDAWTFPLQVMDPPRAVASEEFKPKIVDYTALDSSEVTKKWNVCALFPHTTDDIMRAYIYGTVSEAKRLGVHLTSFEAGGYANVDKQIAQFDDCVTLGANAILLFAVSPVGLNDRVREARAKGIKIVDVNVGVETPVDARVIENNATLGALLGKKVVDEAKDGANLVMMPGPAGVSWSESAVIGLKSAIAGSNVKLDKVYYGDPSRLAQLPLVEDSLATFDKIDYLVGMSTAVEAALNALREQGRQGEVKLYSTFIQPSLVEPIRKGDVSGVVVESSVMLNTLAMELAVRALENKLIYRDAFPQLKFIDKTNLTDEVLKLNFAPADWKLEMNTY